MHIAHRISPGIIHLECLHEAHTEKSRRTFYYYTVTRDILIDDFHIFAFLHARYAHVNNAKSAFTFIRYAKR